MTTHPRSTISRPTFSIDAGCTVVLLAVPMQTVAETQTLDERLDYSNSDGNSTCSTTFAD